MGREGRPLLVALGLLLASQLLLAVGLLLAAGELACLRERVEGAQAASSRLRALEAQLEEVRRSVEGLRASLDAARLDRGLLREWLFNLSLDLRSLEGRLELVRLDLEGLRREVREAEVAFNSPLELRPFRDLEELRAFLRLSDVSEREYVPRAYDCDDFALDLSAQALTRGYMMWPVFISLGEPELYWSGEWVGGERAYIYANHMACLAKVNDTWVLVEPTWDWCTALREGEL